MSTECQFFAKNLSESEWESGRNHCNLNRRKFQLRFLFVVSLVRVRTEQLIRFRLLWNSFFFLCVSSHSRSCGELKLIQFLWNSIIFPMFPSRSYACEKLIRSKSQRESSFCCFPSRSHICERKIFIRFKSVAKFKFLFFFWSYRVRANGEISCDSQQLWNSFFVCFRLTRSHVNGKNQISSQNGCGIYYIFLSRSHSCDRKDSCSIQNQSHLVCVFRLSRSHTHWK